ncbi:MAG: peptide-methionine (R)-S-oxide reductase MsrB [Nitrospira sp.]|nr:peptide-methionine (R)-S-oxide reductase MsrB [Nitrospira sp.]
MSAHIEIGPIVKVTKTDDEWKKLLAPAAYKVLRHEDTERAFTSPLHENHQAGIYHCAGCDLPAYSSEHKFDSGTGWPSFWQPVDAKVVETRTDSKFFMTRVEVHCARCGGHQGHVFDDGPRPTGLRYCINGLALTFVAG